jgi:hypothetical protein
MSFSLRDEASKLLALEKLGEERQPIWSRFFMLHCYSFVSIKAEYPKVKLYREIDNNFTWA